MAMIANVTRHNESVSFEEIKKELLKHCPNISEFTFHDVDEEKYRLPGTIAHAFVMTPGGDPRNQLSVTIYTDTTSVQRITDLKGVTDLF